jgi:hypothetical protein
MSTATLAMRRNQNLYRTKTATQLGPVSVSILTVAGIVVLALLYLTQITKTGVYGLKVSDLQTKASQLQVNKDNLEVEAARLQSIDRIQSSKVASRMVSENQVSFAK